MIAWSLDSTPRGSARAPPGMILSEDESLLVRLIDDFLLITADRAKAVRFTAAMYGGFPEYGVSISQARTLINFNLKLDGEQLPSIGRGTRPFPYCGIAIDTGTLDLANFMTPALEFDRTAVFHTLTNCS